MKQKKAAVMLLFLGLCYSPICLGMKRKKSDRLRLLKKAIDNTRKERLKKEKELLKLEIQEIISRSSNKKK